jgi:uncharacterized membrane protein YkvA (DUF1232 family)
MPLNITFTISDRDLQRFQTIVTAARASDLHQQSCEDIERAIQRIVDIAMTSSVPDFIAERLLHLKLLLEMVNDEEWNLEESGRTRILTALSYFSDPVDLIPDHIPGVGFLDDAIFAEIVFLELEAELNAYREFCKFRATEDKCLRSAGLEDDPQRAQRIRARRDELLDRIASARQHADDEFTFQLL